MRAYADKLEKWKGLKEALANQVLNLTGQLRDQQEAIRALTQEKHGFSAELERQKELNRYLVETTSKGKELNDLRLAEVRHKESLGELDKVKNELDRATRVATELEESIVEEQKKPKKANEEARTLKEQLQDEQLILAATRWTDISVKLARLEEIAGAAKAEAKLRAEEAQSHRHKLNENASKIAELEAERAAQAALLAKLETELENSKNEIKEHSAKSEALQKSLDESETLCDDRGVEIEAKGNRITELEDLLYAANSKIESLQADLSDKSEEGESLKAEPKATSLDKKKTKKGKSPPKSPGPTLKKTKKETSLPKSTKSTLAKKTREEPLHHASTHRIGKLPSAASLRRSGRVKSKSSQAKGKDKEESEVPAPLDTIVVNEGSGSTAGEEDNVEAPATQSSVPATQVSAAATQTSVALIQNPAPVQNLATQIVLPSAILMKRKPSDDFPTDFIADSGVIAWPKPTGREPRKRIRSEETLDIAMNDSRIPVSEESSQQDDLTYNAARHRNNR